MLALYTHLRPVQRIGILGCQLFFYAYSPTSNGLFFCYLMLFFNSFDVFLLILFSNINFFLIFYIFLKLLLNTVQTRGEQKNQKTRKTEKK